MQNPLSLWDRLFDKISCTKKGQKMVTMKPQNINFSPPENILKSRFEGINIMRNQLCQKTTCELLEIKHEIYTLIGSFDLEMLHLRVFELLMEKGLTDDLFKLKSHYL